MGESIFYIVAYLALCAAVFCCPKVGKDSFFIRQNAFLWLVLALIIAECWASVTAGIMTMLSIPVTLVSVGIGHFIGAVLICLAVHWQKRIPPNSLCGGIPDPRYSMRCYYRLSDIRAADIAMGVLLLALIIFLGYMRFHTANPIIFATIDPAERLGNAMTIAVTQSVVTNFPNQYFTPLASSLFIQTLQPFMADVLPFRFFEWKDLLNLWFTGALFYGAVSLYMRSRFSKAFAFVLTFVFVLGFPWMNQLFGFVYPGVATNLILLVLIAFALLYKGELDKRFAYALISLVCLGLGICYTFYAPPVFIAAFLAILFYERKEGSAGLGRIALTEIAVFIVPAIWTFITSVMVDMNDEFNVGSSITAEGAIYRNLFTDFLPYAPFAFWLVWLLLSKRKFEFPLAFTLCFAVYQIAFFALMMTWHVSTYYYYKLYNATWLIFLFLACLAIDMLVRHARVKRLIAVYFICWALVAALGVSGVDYMLNSRRPLSNEQPGADVSFRIYSTNLLYFRPPGVHNVINYDWDFIELCTEARRLAGPVDESRRIEIVTEQMKDTFWKDALTSQFLVPALGRPDNTAGLWIVLKDSDIYNADKEYYDSLEILFENGLGFVVDPA
ncbi:MAG: hypothetical protein FWH32_00030 [Clostridiales bacterium]|nr:hypothetical protein [Clostridiales bacterium]